MEVFLILIHIVLFSSDNLEPGQELDHKAEAENIQTNYMLFLHRYNNNSHEVDWFNQYSFIVSSNFEVIWTLNRVTKRLNKICQAAPHCSLHSCDEVCLYARWIVMMGLLSTITSAPGRHQATHFALVWCIIFHRYPNSMRCTNHQYVRYRYCGKYIYF